jgi:hypothetical protein
VKHALNIKPLMRQPVEAPAEGAEMPGPADSSPAGPAIGRFRLERRTVLMGLGALLALLALFKIADWWTTGRFEVRTDNA